MEAIILAGGLGTRLRSVVPNLPKPLARIGGRPFLAYLLDFLASQGITSVLLSVGYRAVDIVSAFGSRHGDLALGYVIEEAPLGTGGALRDALSRVERFPVLAMNGDTYLEFDHRAMVRAHVESRASLSLAVSPRTDTGRYGQVIVAEGRVVAFDADGAGPGFINCGCYLLADNLLDDPALPETFSFERDFLAAKVAALRPMAFVTDGYFIDIGVPEDYVRAQTELAGRRSK